MCASASVIHFTTLRSRQADRKPSTSLLILHNRRKPLCFSTGLIKAFKVSCYGRVNEKLSRYFQHFYPLKKNILKCKQGEPLVRRRSDKQHHFTSVRNKVLWSFQTASLTGRQPTVSTGVHLGWIITTGGGLRICEL